MPVLGNAASAFTSEYTICNNPLGSVFTFTGGGCQKAISMTMWLRYVTTQRTWKMKGGIYIHPGAISPDFFAQTEERSITPTDSYVPYVFKFTPPVDLTDVIDYLLVGWAEGLGEAYTLFLGRNAGALNQAHGMPETAYASTFPATLAFSHFNHIYGISLEYEQGCVGTFLK